MPERTAVRDGQPDRSPARADTIAQRLLDVLACPTDKAELKLNKEKTALVCAKCAAEYPLKDGIPVLLPK